METKTEKAKKLFLSGKTKEALQIFKDFKLGFSPQEKHTLQIAYECLTGNEEFYKKLGINTSEIKQNALSIVKKLYDKK